MSENIRHVQWHPSPGVEIVWHDSNGERLVIRQTIHYGDVEAARAEAIRRAKLQGWTAPSWWDWRRRNDTKP